MRTNDIYPDGLTDTITWMCRAFHLKFTGYFFTGSDNILEFAGTEKENEVLIIASQNEDDLENIFSPVLIIRRGKVFTTDREDFMDVLNEPGDLLELLEFMTDG